MYFFLNTGPRFQWNLEAGSQFLMALWRISGQDKLIFWHLYFFATPNIILPMPSWWAHSCLWLLALLSSNPKTIPFIGRSILLMPKLMVSKSPEWPSRIRPFDLCTWSIYSQIFCAIPNVPSLFLYSLHWFTCYRIHTIPQDFTAYYS